jgi:hypothetical protein
LGARRIVRRNGGTALERHLYAYEYVSLDYQDIVELLERVPTAILQPATEAASEHAHDVLSTLVVPIGGFKLARDVSVSVGDLHRAGPARAKLPLQWHAAQHQGLFPEMTAELEIAALSLEEPHTQISIIGSYVPPVGLVGAVGDSLGSLYRLADAAVHRLVNDVCRRLTAELGG